MSSERLADYIRSVVLEPESGKLLLKGKLDEALAQRVQHEAQAYFLYRPDYFGGVVAHPPDKGPERPYFRPNGDPDWNPIIQAIGRIGVQSEYWDCMHGVLASQTINLEGMRSMVILPLYPTNDGEVELDINTYPSFLENAARAAGDEQPRYPGYIKMVNYGGDADFYGAQEESIFPMSVKILSGQRVKVDISELGLTKTAVRAAWDSWKQLHNTHSVIYNDVVTRALGKGEFSQLTTALLEEQQKSSGGFHTSFDILNPFLHARGRYTVDELIHELDEAYKIISVGFQQLYSHGEAQKLVDAAASHAQNIGELYETARANRRDVYRY